VTAGPGPGRDLLDGLVAIWAATLGRDCEEDTDLLLEGVDSLAILRMTGPIGELVGAPVSVGAVLDAPTPRELAEMLHAAAPRSDR
jgi:phosphopantetheine binding protein